MSPAAREEMIARYCGVIDAVQDMSMIDALTVLLVAAITLAQVAGISLPLVLSFLIELWGEPRDLSSPDLASDDGPPTLRMTCKADTGLN